MLYKRRQAGGRLDGEWSRVTVQTVSRFTFGLHHVQWRPFFAVQRANYSMVTIRLARGGTRGRPFYHIVVTDSRRKRDGRYIEQVGFFNPIATGGETELTLDTSRVDFWIARGAQLSERVRHLVKRGRKQEAAAA